MNVLMKLFFLLVFILLIYVFNTYLNKESSLVLESSEKDEEYKKMSTNQHTIDANKSGNLINNPKTSTSIYKQLEPEILDALNQRLNTSSEGLTEVKSDNSISVDLEGRFQTVPVAKINEKGEVEVEDFTGVPKTASHK